MRLTNRHNLPQAIVNAIKADPYSKGDADISVTGLLGPARKRQLEIRHAHEIEEDAADRIWSIQGQAIHVILERAADPTVTLIEERLFMKRYGWTISGQFDSLVIAGKTLQDYKNGFVHAFQRGVKDEWIAQLNLYRLLLIDNGFIVPEKLQIVMMLRDWSKAKARNPSYPQSAVQIIDIPVWDQVTVEGYLRDRLMAHGTAQTELPECTDEERWKSDDVFAVMGEGNIKASSTHTILEAAEADAEERSAKGKKQYHVESRTGENRRCADYCAVSAFCSQWKAINPDRLGLMGGNKAA